MDQRRSRLGDGCTSDGEESAQPGGDRAGRVAAGIITALWLPRGRASLFSGAVLLFSHSVVSDSLVTPWTAARQAPLSMDFFRQGYWSGLPFPSPLRVLFNKRLEFVNLDKHLKFLPNYSFAYLSLKFSDNTIK